MSLLSSLALLSLALGYALQRPGWVRASWLRLMSRLLIQAVYPSLILSSLLTRFTWDAIVELWQLPLYVALLLALGLLLGLAFRYQVEDEKRRRSFVFLASMPNYSYVPLVVAEAFWQEKGIALVAIAGLGADFFLWTFALPQIRGQSKPQWRQLASPPMLSLVLAMVILRFRDSLAVPPPDVLMALGLFGKLTIPLSMFLLGSHLARSRSEGQDRRAHRLLLAWHLLLAPACMLLLLWIFPLPQPEASILLLIASMPAAIVSVVLSELYGASPAFCSFQIWIGHLCWIATGPFWLWFGKWLMS